MTVDKNKETIRNAVRGCLLGGAVGDALGYPVEFLQEGQIFAQYGAEGITEYRLDRRSGTALISDDTQMTLFTADAVLAAEAARTVNGSAEPLRCYAARAYLDWLITQEREFSPEENRHSHRSWLLEVPALYSLRAPGNTCLSALRELRDYGIPDDFLKEKRNNSKGCGGVMRVAPVGCCAYSAEACAQEAAQVAAITHGHSLGYMTASVLAHIIHTIIYDRGNATLKEIVENAGQTVCALFKDDPHVDTLRKLMMYAVALSENSDTDLHNIHRLGEGWVAEETLAIAIYCALKYQNDFSKGVTVAVNHNGDSDSTGAVTGNILGAWLGFGRIEDKWKKNLELYDVVSETAEDLCRCFQTDECGARKDAAWAAKYLRTR